MQAKLKFLGSGGAFASTKEGNTNALLSIDGKNLLIDFGVISNIIWREEWGLSFNDIDAIYCSHVHADHTCLEPLFFWRYFIPKLDGDHVVKMRLFSDPTVLKELWDHLSPSMRVYRNEILHITNFAECHSCSSFKWQGVPFAIIRNPHITSSFGNKDAYGLEFEINGHRVYWSSDTSSINEESIQKADTVFHDCEVLINPSGVHTHFNELIKLPKEFKSKMFLMHYNIDHGAMDTLAKDNGFAGAAAKNMEFVF